MKTKKKKKISLSETKKNSKKKIEPLSPAAARRVSTPVEENRSVSGASRTSKVSSSGRPRVSSIASSESRNNDGAENVGVNGEALLAAVQARDPKEMYEDELSKIFSLEELRLAGSKRSGSKADDNTKTVLCFPKMRHLSGMFNILFYFFQFFCSFILFYLFFLFSVSVPVGFEKD